MKNPTSRTADHWKRKTAMAIGKPALADAPDEKLETAHDAHMQEIAILRSQDHSGDANTFPAVDAGSAMIKSLIKTGMPPGPGSVANEEARRSTAMILVNEAVAKGMDYDTAFNAVRTSRPDLFTSH